jgi:hypothetical protein
MKTIDTIKIISDKYNSKATGGLFLLDEAKKLLQIYFLNGEMISIKTRNITGSEALEELTRMKPIKFQFHDGAETRNLDKIPSTENIISRLIETKNQSNQQRSVPEHFEEQVRDLFVEYVGPIADVIFEEQIETSTSLDNLITVLSTYIEDTKDKESFISKASIIA